MHIYEICHRLAKVLILYKVYIDNMYIINIYIHTYEIYSRTTNFYIS